MKKPYMASPMVGNDFMVLPKLRHVAALPAAVPAHVEGYSDDGSTSPDSITLQQLLDSVRRISERATFLIIVTAFLLIGVAGIKGADVFYTNRIPAPAHAYMRAGVPTTGLNIAVPSSDIVTAMDRLSRQSITLTYGSKSVAVPSDTIRSWLQASSDQGTGKGYIHVNQSALTKSVQDISTKQTSAPVNPVSFSHEDGNAPYTTEGTDGTSVDTAPAIRSLANGILAGDGMKIDLPLKNLPFHAVSPADFDKILEVNVTSKRMYAYEHGKLVRTLLVSAGAPATPTVLGTYHIFEKLPVQDMRGLNANGTRYFQPHVRWINYFYKDYAVHGNYWRPHSWFGAINSSHGCVSVPDEEAKWVYDWAPIGTTVVTHS